MRKWGKKGLIIIGLAVITVVIILSMFKSVKVEMAQVQQTDVVATVTEKGQIVSSGNEEIYSEIQGKMSKVLVEEGDSVKQGSILAIIDTEDLKARINQLEAELKAAKGSELISPAAGQEQVIQQQLALEQAKISLNQAEKDYKRDLLLFEAGGITNVELEQAKTEFETQKKSVAQLNSSLSLAKTQSKGNVLQYQGQKESLVAQLGYLYKQRAKAEILAGRTGVVFVKKVKTGDVVSPGSFLFTIGSTDDLKIEAYINSKDMANVKVGNTVNVTLKRPGQDIVVPGVIKRISPVTQEVASALGVIEDRVKITIGFKEQPKGVSLIPGMNLDVNLTTQSAKKVIAVSKDSVFSDQGEDKVWVVRDGKAKIIKVETGVEGDNLIEITKGVVKGDFVILNPHQSNLKDGIKVSKQ